MDSKAQTALASTYPQRAGQTTSHGQGVGSLFTPAMGPTAVNAPVAQIHFVQQESQVNIDGSTQPSGKGNGVMKLLKRLAYVQVVSAVLIFLLGYGCVHNASYGYRYTYYSAGCYFKVGIWNGILAIIAGAFAVSSARKPKNRCFAITRFVLAIIVSVGCGILVLVSIGYATSANGLLSRIEWYKERLRSPYFVEVEVTHYLHAGRNFTHTNRIGDHYRSLISTEDRMRVALAINLLLVFLALTHMIACTVSSSLFCYQWSKTGCCGPLDQVATTARVIYIANQPQSDVPVIITQQPQYIVAGPQASQQMPATGGFIHPYAPQAMDAPPAYDSNGGPQNLDTL